MPKDTSEHITDLRVDMAEVKTKESHDRQKILELQETMELQAHALEKLLEWKAACDNTNKLLIKIVMIVSAVATSIGVWLDNIKASIRMAVEWAVK